MRGRDKKARKPASRRSRGKVDGVPETLESVHISRIPYAVAAQFAVQGTDVYEELVAEGNLALVRWYPKFDPQRLPEGKSDLGAYLYQRVRWAVMRVLGMSGNSKKSRWRHYRSLDCPAMNRADELPRTLAHYVPSREGSGHQPFEARDCLEMALSVLTDRERSLFLSYRGEGKTVKELAVEEGVCTQRVKQILKKAERKIANWKEAVYSCGGELGYEEMSVGRRRTYPPERRGSKYKGPSLLKPMKLITH